MDSKVEIYNFCHRAAKTMSHFVTGKESNSSIDRGNSTLVEDPTLKGRYTFTVWVNSPDLDVCVEGCWWESEDSPYSMALRVLPPGRKFLLETL